MNALRVTWLAERDGTAHAHVGRGRIARAACGARAIDPRHSWPSQRRDPECVEAVKKLEADAPTRAR